MEFMTNVSDSAYDLGIIDTDYGIGEDWKKDSCSRKNKIKTVFNTAYKNNNPPDENYFSELFRITKHQIIWGYNYFSNLLPVTNHIIIWDKMRNVKKTKKSEAELAWTDIHIPMRIYHIRWDGCKKGKETGIITIHPHQKPILLYKNCLQDYAKPGWKIFSSHVGSGSDRIACYDMGFEFEGCEIVHQLWESQEARFQNYIAQNELFSKQEIQKQIYAECYLNEMR
jgi:site-specific DNA-methyltransferase (adenine-specific)